MFKSIFGNPRTSIPGAIALGIPVINTLVPAEYQPIAHNAFELVVGIGFLLSKDGNK